MSNRKTWLMLVMGAATVVVCFRQAYAVPDVAEVRLQRVCVLGMRIELPAEPAGGRASFEKEPLAVDDPCGLPAVPLGLPGERLLSARLAPRGGMIAQRVRLEPGPALEAAVAALAGQGSRENAASRIARARNPALRMASFSAAGGDLYAIAVAAPTGEGSVVLAIDLGKGVRP
jgi:hypothetical protein